MKARELVGALGGRWFGSYGTARCVVHDDRRPSLKLSDGENGKILVHCYVCGVDRARDILGELRRRGFLNSMVDDNREDRSERIRREAQDGRRRREDWARRIWQESVPAAGTIVETYLRNRGIVAPIPLSLRFHQRLENAEVGAIAPAMVAAVQISPSREVRGVHRTYLAPDGSSKAFGRDSKLSLGTLSGGAVRLAAAGPEFALGEGIETCLSYMQATGTPTWAALSTSGLRSIILPDLPLASTVFLLLDVDGNGAGQAAVDAAATRLHRQGRTVKIARPLAGKDFNDALRVSAHA